MRAYSLLRVLLCFLNHSDPMSDRESLRAASRREVQGFPRTVCCEWAKCDNTLFAVEPMMRDM